MNTTDYKADSSRITPHSLYRVCMARFWQSGLQGWLLARCQKLPPCAIVPMPDGSKTDTLLAKAEPMSASNDGSGSEIVYLTRGKNCCTAATLPVTVGER